MFYTPVIEFFYVIDINGIFFGNKQNIFVELQKKKKNSTDLQRFHSMRFNKNKFTYVYHEQEFNKLLRIFKNNTLTFEIAKCIF